MHAIGKMLIKISFGLLCLFFVSLYSISSAVRNYSLITLSIPSISEIDLPPPLQLTQLSSSVLGAQAFDATDIVTYVNLEREKRAIAPLRMNSTLTKAAQMRADVILKHQNFSHQDPYEGIELSTVMPKLGYRYSYASENIGMGGVSGDNFVKGFMNSTSHRENLLNKDLIDTGIAVVTGQYQNYYVNIAVEIFAIPSTKEEYLGYSPEDAQEYKKLLSATELLLNPLIKHFYKFANPRGFSDLYYQNLQHQKDILSQLYFQISQEKPFTASHVKLIEEFNSLQSIKS